MSYFFEVDAKISVTYHNHWYTATRRQTSRWTKDTTA